MLYVIGIGPGNPEYMTEEASHALAECELIVGYPLYLEFVKKKFPEKEYYGTPMTREIERCRYALAQAGERLVALVCSGDAGVYGMAGPVLELAPEYPGIEVRIVPGVTAALGGAARLGAPLMHDFAVISLSDRLTPMEEICRKLKHAAESDFVIALYNPSSRKRKDYLRMACDILLTCLAPTTVCGYVRNVGRDEPQSGILSLEELKSFEADMFTTIFVGNSRTKIVDGRMVTPRGYEEKISTPILAAAGPTDIREESQSNGSSASVLIAAGTTEGRKLCEYFARRRQTVYAFVATEYGEEMLPESPYILTETGRKNADEMLAFLKARGIRTCYDAMHPYATQAHKNMKEACERSGCAYTRVLREESGVMKNDPPVSDCADARVRQESAATCTQKPPANDPANTQAYREQEAGRGESKVIRVSSIPEAAEYLKSKDGNILITTGSRELKPFTEITNYAERILVRVLPSAESLEACRKAGIPGKQIIAMHGPFSKEMNELILREHEIQWLVTKDSGKAGGFSEKLDAAKAAGAHVVIVERPQEDSGITLQKLILRLEQESVQGSIRISVRSLQSGKNQTDRDGRLYEIRES